MTIIELRKMTENFSVDVYRLGNEMNSAGWENLSDWFTYSGLDIGRYVARSCGCIEVTDFIEELKIAMNRANETNYWLGIIYSAEIISKIRYEILKYKCNKIRIEIAKAIKNASEVNI